jgi:DNA-binding winged helix-turn-helix (wHTH) protein
MTARTYLFGTFELRVATRMLQHVDGHALILPARVFDCVVHLIDQRARAIGRDELIAVIWNRPDVGDNVLAQLLARIRRIVEDTGEEQRVIRTIPGFGYQWIADTRVVDDGSVSLASTTTSEPAEVPQVAHAETVEHLESVPIATGLSGKSRRPIHRQAPLMVFLLGLAVVCSVVLGIHRGRDAAKNAGDSAPTQITGESILVLPAVVDSDSGDGWMRFGLMAMVSERMAKTGMPTVPVDNVVALTKGVDTAKLDARGSVALAKSVTANRVLQIRATRGAGRWSVSLTLRSADSREPLAITSVEEQPFDAAREAVDRLLVGMGLNPHEAGTENELALTLRQAEAESFEGKFDAARALLIAARPKHADAAELNYQIGMTDYFLGNFDLAKQEFEQLAQGLSPKDDPIGLARTFNSLANVQYQRRNFPDVERYSQQAIDLLQNRLDAADELGRAWRGRARAAAVQGQYDVSLRDGARARMILAARGNWLGVAQADTQTGIVLRQQGRARESVPVLERAANQLREFHDPYNEAVARVHLASALLDLVDPAAALEQESRIGELDSRVQRPTLRAALKLYRANILVAAGRLAQARPLLDESYQYVVSQDDRLDAYWAHAVAARYALAANDTARAENEALTAISMLFDSEEDDRDVAWTYLMLARLQAAHDDAAVVVTRRAFQQRIEGNAKGNGALYLHLIDAEIAIADGKDPNARDAFERAIGLSDAAPIDLVRVAQGYVPWLLDHGDQELAGDILGRLGDLTHRSFDASLLEVRLYQATQQKAAWRDALDRAQSMAGERTIFSGLSDASVLDTDAQ